MLKHGLVFMLLLLGHAGFLRAETPILTPDSLTYGEPTNLSTEWAFDTAWSFDSQTLALGLTDALLVADATDLTNARLVPVDGTIYDLTFTPDGQGIIGLVERGALNQRIQRELVLWTTTETRTLDFATTTELFLHAQFAPDGKTFVVSVLNTVGNGVIWLYPYQAETMSFGEKREIASDLLPSLRSSEHIEISAPSISQDSQRIALSNGRVVAIYDLETGNRLQQWDYADANADLRYLRISLNPNGKQLAMVPIFDFESESGMTLNRYITVVDAETFDVQYQVDVEKSFNTFAWSPDGTELLAGSQDLGQEGFSNRQYFVFDASDGTLITKILDIMLMPYSEVSPNGEHIVGYSTDGVVIMSRLSQ